MNQLQKLRFRFADLRNVREVLEKPKGEAGLSAVMKLPHCRFLIEDGTWGMSLRNFRR